MIAVQEAMMGGMPMPGGWAMSMAWTRMPAQTWLGAGASFLGMWIVMMAAMMLPSMTPLLWRYGQAWGAAGRARAAGSSALVYGGYLFVWAVLGMALYPLGVSLAALQRHMALPAGSAPIAIGFLIVVAGAIELTAWKAHHLACYREAIRHCHTVSPDVRSAWRHGLRLGVHCSCCSAALMVVLLVIGMMDLRVMAVATIAISIERLAPAGERIARALGAVGVAAGLVLIARASGFA